MFLLSCVTFQFFCAFEYFDLLRETWILGNEAWSFWHTYLQNNLEKNQGSIFLQGTVSRPDIHFKIASSHILVNVTTIYFFQFPILLQESILGIRDSQDFQEFLGDLRNLERLFLAFIEFPDISEISEI